MKYLKMLGLAVMAAAALTAIIGASAASATVLCTETTTPCPAGKKIGPTGDSTDNWIHAVLEEKTLAVLSTTANEPLVECEESTVTMESTHTGSATETPDGHVTALTFGKCNHGVNVLAGGKLEVHWIEGTHNGTVTSKEAEVTVSILGVSCTYGSGAGISIGDLTGGTMATMDISTVVQRVAGGFLCPATARWAAKYTVTEPEPLYVLKE